MSDAQKNFYFIGRRLFTALVTRLKPEDLAANVSLYELKDQQSQYYWSQTMRFYAERLGVNWKSIASWSDVCDRFTHPQ